MVTIDYLFTLCMYTCCWRFFLYILLLLWDLRWLYSVRIWYHTVTIPSCPTLVVVHEICLCFLLCNRFQSRNGRSWSISEVWSAVGDLSERQCQSYHRAEETDGWDGEDEKHIRATPLKGIQGQGQLHCIHVQSMAPIIKVRHFGITNFVL